MLSLSPVLEHRGRNTLVMGGKVCLIESVGAHGSPLLSSSSSSSSSASGHCPCSVLGCQGRWHDKDLLGGSLRKPWCVLLKALFDALILNYWVSGVVEVERWWAPSLNLPSEAFVKIHCNKNFKRKCGKKEREAFGALQHCCFKKGGLCKMKIFSQRQPAK